MNIIINDGVIDFKVVIELRGFVIGGLGVSWVLPLLLKNILCNFIPLTLIIEGKSTFSFKI